jgi:hypothetical protein
MADQLFMLTNLAAHKVLQMSTAEGAHLYTTSAQVPPLQCAWVVVPTCCLPAGHMLAVVETVDYKGACQVLQLDRRTLYKAFPSLQYMQLWQDLQASHIAACTL